MKNKTILSIFTIFFIFSSVNVYSFDTEISNSEWNDVKNTPEESSFIIDVFIRNGKNMAGEYPHTLRKRFKDIGTTDDAELLLNKLIDPLLKEQHPFVFTLLKELNGDKFIDLFENKYNTTSNELVHLKIFQLISLQNSEYGFSTALRLLEPMENNEYSEKILYLSEMKRFNNQNARDVIINSTLSDLSIVRSAGYIALGNYADDEVESIINNAIHDETEINNIEKGKSKNDDRQLIINILNSTKNKIKYRKNLFNKNQSENISFDSASNKSAPSSSSDDDELAEYYAPQIRLSSPGFLNMGVDIRDDVYLYTDYIPINVNDLTSNEDKMINLYLANSTTYNGEQYESGLYKLYDGAIEIIGDNAFRSSLNYLDFSPVWEGLTLLSTGYKSLSLQPTIYFKVSRDETHQNPIAIQYWFFYFYNDWQEWGVKDADHPGDWETITVFLNKEAEPVEAVYSTHYEANRHSWANIEVASSHPIVYVSNGGHGSYSWSGYTAYALFNSRDDHYGDEEIIQPSEFDLIDLTPIEDSSNGWVLFEGRWGNGSDAPQGPKFRTDVSSSFYWSLCLNPPYDPYNNCQERNYGAHIYGNTEYNGPWYWAAGYGLDTPWESCDDCEPIYYATHTITPPSNTNIAPGELFGPIEIVHTNNANSAIEYTVQKYLTMPDGITLEGYEKTGHLSELESKNFQIYINIPTNALIGDYKFGIKISSTNGEVDDDSIEFTVYQEGKNSNITKQNILSRSVIETIDEWEFFQTE